MRFLFALALSLSQPVAARADESHAHVLVAAEGVVGGADLAHVAVRGEGIAVRL